MTDSPFSWITANLAELSGLDINTFIQTYGPSGNEVNKCYINLDPAPMGSGPANRAISNLIFPSSFNPLYSA